MNLKRLKNLLYTLGVTLIFVVTPGCFTGVESTPRIQADKDAKGEENTSPEDLFFAPISKQAPGKWTAGKKFTVVDDRFRRLLGATAPDAYLSGQVITLTGILPAATVLGDTVMELKFASALSKDPLVYRTTVSARDWKARPSFSIPFLVETDIIERATEILTNKRFWVRTRTGWASGAGRRFIPVIIDSVSGGDETYPLQVKFHAEDNTEEIGRLFLSDAGARPGDRHAFGAYFSLKDSRGEYPGISDATWSAIVLGKPIAGMTPNEVRLCLGSPKEVRNNNTSSILRQEWLYADGRVLSFENQVLVSWN